MLRFPSARFLAPALTPLLLLGLWAAPASADNPTPTPTPITTPETGAPVAPAGLTMSVPGSTTTLAPGSWTSSDRLIVHFQVQTAGSSVVPQVEVKPSSVPFTGQPTAHGTATAASGIVAVTIGGLANGKTYHWQARVSGSNGQASPWTPFSTGSPATFDVGVDRTAPIRPVIHSPSDPLSTRWYNNKVVALQWTSHDALSGVAGYTYVVERNAHVIPPGRVTTQTSISLPHISNGVWFLALRSVDHAGNWSATATYRIQLDRTRPNLVWLSQSRFNYNPYSGPATVHFRFTKPVAATFKLYRMGTSTPVATYSFKHLSRGQIATITWTGKGGNGRFVGKGYYFFTVHAVDHANNRGIWHVAGIRVNPVRPVPTSSGVPVVPGTGKRIVVSLSQETLYAYDGSTLFLKTLVTTGNPTLPTPPGHYTIMAKYHPYEFISPWPPGSPFYYAPSPVNYAMLFRSGGYFIHDAPWRSAFGPGTNGPGQPGTDYGGSHGCVNTPLAPMEELFAWTPIGTPVDVVP